MTGEEGDSDAEPQLVTVAVEAGGSRLDAFLAAALPRHSRSRWRALIDAGHVAMAGRSVRPALKVQPGDVVEIDEPPPAPTSLVPEEIPLTVVYEDEHLLVIDKPAGLVVHPAPGHPGGTLVNALLHRVPGLDVGGEQRPGIVHRLDKDTSGLIVCAKHDEAHRALADAFRSRAVEKRYLAFALGEVAREELVLVTGHARHPTDRRRFTTRVDPPDDPSGLGTGGVRRAEAVYRQVRAKGGLAEVAVELRTGRTHQIRAQLADLGHPIAGDELYGGGRPGDRVAPGPVRDALRGLARQALHAAFLAFPHPIDGQRLAFEADLPSDLASLRAALLA